MTDTHLESATAPSREGSGGGLVRLRLELAYDGTDFHGWAAQPGLRTVQGVLEEALARVLHGVEPRTVVAGRTDAGVHARRQFVHLDVPADAWRRATARSGADGLAARLRGVLKHDPDLVVTGVGEAPDGFDARFSAIWRRYTYRIADRPETWDPITRRNTLWSRRPLDLTCMRAASARLLGLHDWASYCRPRPGATTIRTLQQLDWVRNDAGVIVATVRADAFCHNMVRALVGAHVAVGQGRLEPEDLASILAERRRTPRFAVAPAHGLTLDRIGYPDDALLGAQAERARARRELPDD